MRTILLPPLALLALAACDGGTRDAEDPATPAETATPTPAPAATQTTPATAIPLAIRGRWGLVPADCESGRDDAKGLLTIGATRLEFYESVATLGAITESEAARIRASFDFEGEGMTWQGEVELDVEDGGATLIRREFGEDSAPEPFRYANCNQG